MNKAHSYFEGRIASIQRELEQLKKQLVSPRKQKLTLEGVWKGLQVSETEVEEAKRSLFKGAHDEAS